MLSQCASIFLWVICTS